MFSAKVCAILTNYLVCTVPAATVLAVDPSAELLSKVPTQNITIIVPIVTWFLSHHSIIWQSSHQAHIPTYMICWFGVIINPLLYVLCNPAYRLNIADISDTNMSLITHHKLIHLLSWSRSIRSYSRASFYARFSYSGNL